jgi:hypothetical protein
MKKAELSQFHLPFVLRNVAGPQSIIRMVSTCLCSLLLLIPLVAGEETVCGTSGMLAANYVPGLAEEWTLCEKNDFEISSLQIRMVGLAGSFLCRVSGPHRWNISQAVEGNIWWRFKSEGLDTGEQNRRDYYHPAVMMTAGYRYSFRLMTVQPVRAVRFILSMKLPNKTDISMVAPHVETCEVNGCVDTNALRKDSCVAKSPTPTPPYTPNVTAIIVVVVAWVAFAALVIIVFVALWNSRREETNSLLSG